MEKPVKDKKVKLTVIMPLYNRADLMQRALDSIYMQNVKFKYKILILDDASTDNSLEIAKANKKKFFNIEIIENKENLGLLKSIFIGQDKLQNSEYFCVLDPDDYWTDKEYLHNAVTFLDNHFEYNIYSANIDVMHSAGNTTKYVQTNQPFAKSCYEAFLKQETIYMPSTQATLYRNVVYTNGVPEKLKNYIAKYAPQGFRADTFRFLSHLKKGLAYFENKTVAVYDTTSTGLWTNLSMPLRHIQSVLLYLHLSQYFDDDKESYFKIAYKNFDWMIASYQNTGIYPDEKVKFLHFLEEVASFTEFREIDDKIPLIIKQILV